MVDTTLKAYIAELKLLLEQEALEEVMGHCRHILQHFPKNVETYRILGRALLEKNRHQEAGDVFQRVLSALPDDFVSHLGLSGVAEEAGQIPLAIFHLERAFEQEPNNAALRDEIKRLYEKRDGIAPERLQVTLGGLVQSYVKGRLYEQAVAELTKALAAAPDRVDWQLLLTRVLWESDRPVEAADSALQVLEKLPDSIDANRIMSELWLRASRPSDAAPFIARLEQLDPFLAWSIVNPGKELPRDAFSLPRLDWDARAAAAMATDVPDWMNSISNVFEAPESVSLSGGLDWTAADTQAPTKRPQSGLLRARGNTDQLNQADPFSAASQPTNDNDSVEIPDWFSDVADASSAPTSTSVDTDDVPDWFKDASPSAPAEAAVPSWLDDDMPDVSDIAGNQLPSGFTDLLAGSSSQPPAPVAPQAEAIDAMSWLNTGPLPSLDEPAPAAAEPAELDWMMDLPADNTTSAEPEASGAMDAMSWLNTGPLPSLDEPVAEPASTESVDEQPTFDWLDSASTTESSVEAAEPEASGAMDAMSWLNTGSLPALDEILPASEPAANVTNEEPAFDWLSSTSDSPEPAAEMSEPASLDAAQEEPMFDWLNNAAVAGEAQPAVEDAVPAEASSDIDSALDWMSETPEPEVASNQPDPMAWFQKYSDSTESNEQEGAPTGSDSFNWADNEVPSAEATETPEWVSRLAPNEDALAREESSGIMDFTGPNAGSSISSEPSLELEDDWLASFETGSLANTRSAESAAAEPASSDWTPESAVEPSDDWMSSFATNETPAEPAQSADDWFKDAETVQPAASSSIPDQNEWTMLENPGSVPSDDWLSEQSADSSEVSAANAWATAEPAASSGDDWMSSLDLSQGTPEPATSTDNDWLGSMQSTTDSRAAEPTTASGDDWLASLGTGEAASGDWLTPEANDDFENLLKGAAEEANQPRVVGESGQLNASSLPDWMSAFPGDASAEPATADASDWGAGSGTGSALDGLDFSDLGGTEEAQPASESADWLSSIDMTDTEITTAGETPDWLSSMAAPAAQSSAPDTSLDDFDFDSLESAPAEPAGETPDWLSSMAAPAQAQASASDFSLDDLDFGSLESAPAEPAGETPDWLSSMAAPAEASTSGTSLDNLDFGSLESAPAEPAGETPDWLSSMAAPEPAEASTSDFSLDDLDFNSLEGAPAEPAGETPDWLSSMAAPAAQSSVSDTSFDDLDFGSLESAPAEPASETPDWISSIGTPAQASAPDTSFDDLDFGSLESAPALPPVEDGPDWLSAFATEPEPVAETQETQPAARHAMPAHFPEVDLSKLPEDAAEDSSSEDYAFSFNQVAQPGDLVNTNTDSESFTFQRKPAWMRKRRFGQRK